VSVAGLASTPHRLLTERQLLPGAVACYWLRRGIDLYLFAERELSYVSVTQSGPVRCIEAEHRLVSRKCLSIMPGPSTLLRGASAKLPTVSVLEPAGVSTAAHAFVGCAGANRTDGGKM
jgi:hypothetical protein